MSMNVFYIRFQKGDLDRLGRALQLPEKYVCSQGTVATGMEALLIMLRRLAYPNRWSDLVPIFGRAQPELTAIFHEVYSMHCVQSNSGIGYLYILLQIMEDIFQKFNHLLTSLELIWLDPAVFSDAIHAKGAALQQCWGFIDGTVRPIARPTRNQRIMYSGHKRIHCLKFQVWIYNCKVYMCLVFASCYYFHLC